MQTLSNIRWVTAILGICLGLLAARPACANLIAVNGSWTSNHTIALLWDSYEVVYNWDELGPFRPFEDHLKEANDLHAKFKSGDYKAIVLHLSMRNDSGHDLKLGFNIPYSADDGCLWLGGADGSAFCSGSSIAGGYYTGWLLGDTHGAIVSSGADLTSYIPDGMVNGREVKSGESVRGRVVLIVPKSFVPVELYVHTGKNTWSRDCLYGSQPLSIKIAAAPSTAPSVATGPRSPSPGVTGSWTSDSGTLMLAQDPTTDKTVPVTGFWVKPGASDAGAYITSGSFNPLSGELEMTVTPTGSTDTGHVVLKLGPGGKTLGGTASQVGEVKISDQWQRDTVKDMFGRNDHAIIYGIYFLTDSASLRPESAPALLEVARALRDDRTLRLRIIGYTDSTGKPDHDVDLSQRRADSVKKALKEQYNIDASRLETAGLGADHPVADNGTEQGRALNRRVELVKQP